MSKSTKDIKRMVINQIKNEYPSFNCLPKQVKKEIIEKIFTRIYSEYDFSKEPEVPLPELLNITPLPDEIITIEQMQQLIKGKQMNLLHLSPCKAKQAIKDKELQKIYELVDWNLLNQLLANENYTPGKREILPSQYFRAELLKHLKYPELSYRKYDEREINNPERQENRAFLDLKPGQCITHSQLSQFRSSLNFTQLVNVMIYFICLFLDEKALGRGTFYALDSTELAEKISNYPLFKQKIGNQNIRFYQDIEADVGTRRKKRDKSDYVVGYRLHTLTIIDVNTETAYPLLSVLAPANHHDSNFLGILVEFGKKIGLSLNVVVGDQAYGEVGEVEEIKKRHNVVVLNAPKEKTTLPNHVDEQTYAVRKNDLCPVGMIYCGRDEEYGHEFHCDAQAGECPLYGNCEKVRFIPLDSGHFGQIPCFMEEVERMIQMRKVAERPFNLIKHRDGLEPLRTKGRHNCTVVATVANITTLLIEIAGYRKKRKKVEDTQLPLLKEVA
jgi:hypothetical protein